MARRFVDGGASTAHASSIRIDTVRPDDNFRIGAKSELENVHIAKHSHAVPFVSARNKKRPKDSWANGTFYE